MRRTLVQLALRTRLPLSDLLTWEPGDIATALEWIDNENDAIKDANKGR